MLPAPGAAFLARGATTGGVAAALVEDDLVEVPRQTRRERDRGDTHAQRSERAPTARTTTPGLALRSHGWTRHLPKDNVFGEKPEAFRFILPGYNVRPTEIQGAVGLEQMKKLDKIIEVRRDNARRFPLKTQKEIGKSSWYGFAVFGGSLNGYETRPIVSGNFVRHPTIKYYDYEAGELPNTDWVSEHGLMIGNHPTPIDWHDIS